MDIKPNKKNLRKWVEALRSENYRQTTGCLKYVDRYSKAKITEQFCCLGVACDISGLGKWDNENFTYIVGREKPARMHLPKAVAKWLGVEGVDPILLYSKGEVDASELNDEEHLKFSTIADCIERTYNLVPKKKTTK